jgi:hypothetical protein
MIRLSDIPTLVFVAAFILCIASAWYGFTYGWLTETLQAPMIIQDMNYGFQVKPITLFLYSAMVVGVWLIWRTSTVILPRLNSEQRLFTALLMFVPESVYGYELLWHFFEWSRLGLVNTLYAIYHTKSNFVLLMLCLAVQASICWRERYSGKQGLH